MKILIVDDDAGRSIKLKNFLEDRNLHPEEVLIATNSDDARAALRSRYFDAVILDVVLPKRSGSTPAHDVGLDLLDEISRSKFLKKPERVIGITAHLSDIESFKHAFEQKCTVVIEARTNASNWMRTISDNLDYLFSSKLARFQDRTTVAISIHGIRTFGEWQSRFKAIIEKHTGNVEYHTYRYGYFSSLALLFHPARKREVRFLKKRLDPLLTDLENKRVLVFCHSFGTYLCAAVLENILKSAPKSLDLCIVFCGSVLPSNYDWSYLSEFPNARVINDCGTSDYVLWLSQAFAPRLGMAGKIGFNGFIGTRFLNRFFNGSHSLYFQGDDFMERYWLPLVAGETSTSPKLEYLQEPPRHLLLLEQAVIFVGRFFWLVLVLFIGLAVWRSMT